MKANKIEFTCQKCGKTITVQADIYQKAYVGQSLCLSCRTSENSKENDRHGKEKL